MRCIDQASGRRLALSTLLLLLAGCAQPPTQAPGAAPAAPATKGLSAVPPAVAGKPTLANSTPPAAVAAPAAPAAAAAAVPVPVPAQAARQPRYVKLAAPAAPRNAKALKLQFAQRLVAAHPDTSYTSRAPDRLLAIPVIETELNADGSVRRIEVLRKPTTGDESIGLAIDAIRRAAPYGDVSRLPKPWKVVETFLFDDELRFKPRTLD